MCHASGNLESDTVSVSVYEVTKGDNDLAIKSNISVNRVRAIKSYTHFLGGTFEENREKLRGVSTKEIQQKVRDYRRDNEGSGAEGESGTVRYISGLRLKAVQDYTDVFGGTLEENMRMLRGTTSKEIYEMLEQERNAQK